MLGRGGGRTHGHTRDCAYHRIHKHFIHVNNYITVCSELKMKPTSTTNIQGDPKEDKLLPKISPGFTIGHNNQLSLCNAWSYLF